jgi:hypothetical protein
MQNLLNKMLAEVHLLKYGTEKKQFLFHTVLKDTKKFIISSKQK